MFKKKCLKKRSPQEKIKATKKKLKKQIYRFKQKLYLF